MALYGIGHVAERTGVTAFTIRYYEKIGLLPQPRRRGEGANAARVYEDRDIEFIAFVHGLRESGMRLEDIASFIEGGCLLTLERHSAATQQMLRRRIGMLRRHEDALEREIARLESLRGRTVRKRRVYESMMAESLLPVEAEGTDG